MLLRSVLWTLGSASAVALVTALVVGASPSAAHAAQGGLSPLLRAKLEELQDRLFSEYGLRLFLGSGRRTQEQQRALVDAGRSAKPSSLHLRGEAVDVYVVDPETGKPDFSGRRADLYRTLHRVWASLGGYGLAYWPYPEGPPMYIQTSAGRVWDAGHLQLERVAAPVVRPAPRVS
jgi:hypothetical protein